VQEFEPEDDGDEEDEEEPEYDPEQSLGYMGGD
jgi:hypothetical protein